jgi:plastocyanin
VATQPAPTPDQAFWAVQLDQHAVTLSLTAPTNTIQLHAVPLNANGATLDGLGAVTYSVTDSTVEVDSTGRVTAKYTSQPGQHALVIARLTDFAQRVTLADTCYVQVTATAPTSPLAALSIQPLPGDSATRAKGGFYTITPQTTDEQGNPFPPAMIYYSVADPNIATVDPLTGDVLPLRVGQVTLYATMWAYGVVKQDSLRFTITPSDYAAITVLGVIPTGSTKPTLTFWPAILTVSAGAEVYWSNKSKTDSIDVVFDDPAAAETDTVAVDQLTDLFGYVFPLSSPGNIAPFFADTTGKGANCLTPRSSRTVAQDSTCTWIQFNTSAAKRYRLFSTPGTYHYHSTINGAAGTIVVQ